MHAILLHHSFTYTSFIHITQLKCLRLLVYLALKQILERTVTIWASLMGEPHISKANHL